MRPALPLALLLSVSPALAAITAPETPATAPAFDILSASVTRTGDQLTFAMSLAGQAGVDRPVAGGALAGAPVWSYVWPTSLDPATVGFEGGTGILALAATAHPDFDDTPLYDEDGDGEQPSSRTLDGNWRQGGVGHGATVRRFPPSAESRSLSSSRE